MNKHTNIFLMLVISFSVVMTVHAMDDDALCDRLAEFINVKKDQFAAEKREHVLQQLRILLMPDTKKFSVRSADGSYIFHAIPPLHAAICLAYRAAFDLILDEILTTEERAAILELRDADDETPLFLAVRNADENGDYYVEKLLNYGADAQAACRYSDESGESYLTPLHVGTTPGSVGMLLSHGAVVDARDSVYDRTPLHNAVIGGRVDVAQALLVAGASMSVTDRNGFTPLHCAHIRGNDAMINALQNFRVAADSRSLSLSVNELPMLLNAAARIEYYHPGYIQNNAHVYSEALVDAADWV